MPTMTPSARSPVARIVPIKVANITLPSPMVITMLCQRGERQDAQQSQRCNSPANRGFHKITLSNQTSQALRQPS
jgi:hypothetical protein